MENLDLNAKKLELLSDEELLKVTGGGGELSPTVIEACSHLCKTTTSEERCNQYPFCTWDSAPWGDGKCQYRW